MFVCMCNILQNAWTALTAAAKGGYTDVVSAVLDHDPNVNIVDKVSTIRKILRLHPTQIHITTEQVQAAIKGSKNNNSTGPDNINIKQTHWQARTKIPWEHIQCCTQRQQNTSCMEIGQHHTYPQT